MSKFTQTFSAIAMIMALSVGTAQAEMTKGDIEKIVHDYIMANGNVILESVDQYQQQSIQKKFKDAVKNNQLDLFKNERSPFAGNPDGDVTIVEFFDYNCGYCKRAFGDIDALLKEDKNIKVVFKEFPILSPSSEEAAKWALAAHMQGKFYEMHAAMMKHRGSLDDAAITKYAKEIGLDMDRAKKDIESSELLIEIEKNKALANQMGVTGTPAFIIGEEVIPGAVPKQVLLDKAKELREKNKQQ